MDKYKKIILIVVILLIILIISLIVVLQVSKNEETVEGNTSQEGTIIVNSDGSMTTLEEGDLGIVYNQEKLREPTEFFSVETCIKNSVDTDFTAEEMNYLEGTNIITYSVYGHISSDENNTENYYLVRVDLNNMAFELEDLTDEGYSDIDMIELTDDETEIYKNGSNTFRYTTVTNEEMCGKYLEDINDKAINNSEELYEMIRDDVKEEKFSTLEDFQNYITSNLAEFQTAQLSSYNVQREDEYTEYTIIDNYGNSYTLRTEGIWDYTITNMEIN